jgi:hypothetical protein
MIVHRTFVRKTKMSAKRILRTQEEVRAEAESFVAERLAPGDVLNVTESSHVLPATQWSLFSVTVWYRKE